MRMLFTVCLSVLISSLAMAQSQPAPQNPVPVPIPSPQPQADQWTSHQMNQPPPSLSQKYQHSQERLDELMELYLLAKKEAEAKAQNKSAPPKQAQ